ncbi:MULTISPECIES: TetR/AcrR family transcriptional regulator [Geomonas]|uniref:TetR family transcriptional regulator n=2 Tax=Geomonas TaxID=2651583 RepID=A0A6V8MSF7_9BACT|nr:MULTISPECIES: TetR/AcrR family transcriptional regulator [Geomonas]MBU5612167.1 TetR/AcrR family transcriptional regulator [Geomonas azotofigens]QWV93727.1 TetR/AcrR family transcriptional regulator [Geomonas oryzisoli]UPU35745.1 TetR/AcrR family transcriptional regulator [Geomonas paludis]GFO62677.1 TetR family transcriptional regulator [Geomonas paludis]
MARPKSEDKQKAILNAAVLEIAEHGVSAPTARIAKIAGVAEGSLFTYFSNKDELLNHLYLYLKEELRESMMSDYPKAETVKNRIKHAWEKYVAWGIKNPSKRIVLAKLGMSNRVSEQTKALGLDAFSDVVKMIQESTANGLLRDYPFDFVCAIMGSLADTSMDFIVGEPAKAEYYTNAGFEAFWNAVAND